MGMPSIGISVLPGSLFEDNLADTTAIISIVIYISENDTQDALLFLNCSNLIFLFRLLFLS